MNITHETSFTDTKGKVLSFLVHPNDGEREGFVRLSIQTTHNAVSASLPKGELSQIAQVLRGMREVANDGKTVSGIDGMYSFRHVIEPRSGYLLTIRRDFGEESFLVAVDDALLLMFCVERAIPYVMLGI